MNIKFVTNSLLFVLLLVGFKNSVSMQNTLNTGYNNLNKFLDLTEKNKNNWLKFEKECHANKIDLIIKHINEHFKLKRQHLEDAKKSGSITPELLDSKLNGAIKLHESQIKDWSELHKKQIEKASKLAADHKNEFNKFKNSLSGQEKEGKSEEEITVEELKFSQEPNI